MFERIVLASIGAGLLSLLLSLDMFDMIARMTGTSMGVMMGIPLVIYLLYGLLVYFVARQASGVARWIYVVLAGLGLLFGLAGIGTLTIFPAHIVVLTLLQHALTAASLFMLFQADSNAWFAQGRPAAAYGHAQAAWANQPPPAGAWPAAPAPPAGSWPPAPAPIPAPNAWPQTQTPPQAPQAPWPAAQQPPSGTWPPAAAAVPPQAAQPAPQPTAAVSPPAAQATAQAPNLRRCPFCAEEIRAEAIKCRFCGSEVEPPAA
ncbi:MAG TPA: hypothetical protein VGB08_02320 [Allosphingosinicella sp.]